MHKTSLSGMGAALLTLMLYNTAPAFADEHEHREQEAHEHGVAKLNIAQEGNTLQIELSSPAMNLVGFEHAPRNKQQMAAVKKAVASLQKAEQLFVLSPAAGCRISEYDVDTALLEEEAHGHKEEHGKEEHADEDAHADFDANYVFQCKQPAALSSIEVRLFKLFPGTEEIEVQLLSDKGQRALELTPSQPSIALQ